VAVSAVALVALLSLAGRRLGIAPQIILVAAGVALSYLPPFNGLALDPETVLMGLLPVLLYASALALPTSEFRRDLVPIGALSVVLVVVSAVGVGWLLHVWIAGLPLAAGIALGALLSPTDAAATGGIKPLGLSARVLAILNGEALLNDASALVVLRSSLVAGVVGFSAAHSLGDFAYAAIVAFILGSLIGRLGVEARHRIQATAPATVVSFLVPFAAYLAAEVLGASGLMAVAAAGIATLQRGPHRLSALQRMTEHANWHTMEFLVEGAVFLLMGLQLRSLITALDAGGESLPAALGWGALALVMLLVVRGVFMALVIALVGRSTRLRTARRDTWRDLRTARTDPASAVTTQRTGLGPARRARLSRLTARAEAYARAHPEGAITRVARWRGFIARYAADVDYLNREALHVREGVLLTWAGMRGVVTVAAAQTLPLDLPHRPLLVVIAYAVAAGSLLLQGGTLPLMVRRLGLTGRDTTPPGERRRLYRELFEAATQRLDDPTLHRGDGRPFDAVIVARVRAQIAGHTEPAGTAAPSVAPLDDEATLSATERLREVTALRLVCIEAMRERLLEAQNVGAYTSATIWAALAQLDADEISTRLHEAPTDDE